MRLGQLVAHVEGSAALARRAHRAANKQLHEKANKRFKPKPLAAASRVNARNAALMVATEGVRWVASANGGELGDLEQRLGVATIHRAQAGTLADLQQVGDAVYSARKRA
jgi:acyl-CoA dehydrogenase